MMINTKSLFAKDTCIMSCCPCIDAYVAVDRGLCVPEMKGKKQQQGKNTNANSNSRDL
jgi:hypothetical protein